MADSEWGLAWVQQPGADSKLVSREGEEICYKPGSELLLLLYHLQAVWGGCLVRGGGLPDTRLRSAPPAAR